MKKMMALVMGLFMLLSSALAAVYINEEPPADWSERSLFRLTAIDVDRSDAMLLQCGGESMLVDGGSGQYRDKLFEAVDEAGVTRFKYLFCTHSDNDHIHGLKYLMESEQYQVDVFMSPNKTSYKDDAGYHQMAMRVINRLEIPYQQVEDGDVLTLGDATMTVLRCMESWGANARSAVLMVTFGESRILLTGDIDYRVMRQFVEKYGEEALKADIMKAPHHGLATIVPEFRSVVAPELIFVPNLKKNTRKFNNYMKKNDPDIALLYCGDAEIVMETDGQDWYVWQETEQ